MLLYRQLKHPDLYSTKKVGGFRNLGNSCHMSAILHLLRRYWKTALSRYLFWLYEANESVVLESWKAFMSVVLEANMRIQTDEICPSLLAGVLKLSGKQKDADCMLKQIMETIHEDVLNACSIYAGTTLSGTAAAKFLSPVDNTFTFNLEDRRECKNVKCSNYSLVYRKMRGICLDLGDRDYSRGKKWDVTYYLKNRMLRHFDPEEVLFDCLQCGHKESTKILTIASAPKLLLVQVKRQSARDRRPFQPERCIDLTQFASTGGISKFVTNQQVRQAVRDLLGDAAKGDPLDVIQIGDKILSAVRVQVESDEMLAIVMNNEESNKGTTFEPSRRAHKTVMDFVLELQQEKKDREDKAKADAKAMDAEAKNVSEAKEEKGSEQKAPEVPVVVDALAAADGDGDGDHEMEFLLKGVIMHAGQDGAGHVIADVEEVGGTWNRYDDDSHWEERCPWSTDAHYVHRNCTLLLYVRRDCC